MGKPRILNHFNRLHTEQINKLMLKVFFYTFILSLSQDLGLYFWFKEINLNLLITNVIVMLALILPSKILYQRGIEPEKLGLYNVFVVITYTFFSLWNYTFSSFNLIFLAFNILIAAIYFNKKGFIIVSILSFAETIFFSYYVPVYSPVSQPWLEISARLQVMIYISLFSYTIFKSINLHLTNLIDQELKAMQVAHEIRNPITTVKGFLQLLTTGTEDKREHLPLMMDELDRANSLISDYLTLYKTPQLMGQLCDINFLVSDVVSLLSHQAQSQNIIIQKQLSHGLPKVGLDPNQFKQVIINLLNNALQAIGNNGQVVISTALLDQRLVITITDNGPGIPPVELDKVFMPFFTTKSNGNGLGLAICKTIVHNHGGIIEVENNHPKGTKAEIKLPLE